MSKSGDRNSHDSGDWFNRLDWPLQDNHWGTGVPPCSENEPLWSALKPLLADPAVKPRSEHTRWWSVIWTVEAWRGRALATCCI